MSTETLHGEAVSLEGLVARDPTTPLYLPLAERLLARGQVAEAIRLCEERLARPGKGVGDHIVLGRCYLADGRLAEARAEFQSALDLDRENVVALKSLAGILSHDGKHADAADLYRAVCRVDPGDLESQTALHQIASGEYPEVRPAEVIVDDSGVSWQPIRPEREEDHLPELALGLRTLDSREVEGLLPGPSAAAEGGGRVPPRSTEAPAEPLLDAAEIEVGPSFPSPGETVAPLRSEPPRPASEESFGDRLSGLDVEAFQESALERLEEALRPIEARPLGEVEAPAPETVAPAPQAPDPPAAAPPPAAPTRSAIWGPEAPSSPPEPAHSESPGADHQEPPPSELPRVKGNRNAFESWLRSLGGGGAG